MCSPPDSDQNCRPVPKQVGIIEQSVRHSIELNPFQMCSVMQMTSTKLTPETDCRQESKEVCGPEVCPIVKGERVCANEVKTVSVSSALNL